MDSIIEDNNNFIIDFKKAQINEYKGCPFPWKQELCNLLNESKEKKIYFIQGQNVGKSMFIGQELRINKKKNTTLLVKEEEEEEDDPHSHSHSYLPNCEADNHDSDPNFIVDCTSASKVQYGIFHVMNPSINVYVQDHTYFSSAKPEKWPYGVYASIVNKRWRNTKYKRMTQPSYEGDITHVLVFSTYNHFPCLVTEYGLPLDLIELYTIHPESKDLIKLDKVAEYNNQLVSEGERTEYPKFRRNFHIKYSNVYFNAKQP